MILRHEFVENIPEVLEQGVLYVSIPYRTMLHRCACGCGEEVVTPIGPAAWKMTYDGGGVSIAPSIGNWSLPCRSHYWIERNRVLWAPSYSIRKVARVRRKARKNRERRRTLPGRAIAWPELSGKLRGLLLTLRRRPAGTD